jgi:hypothetical protein
VVSNSPWLQELVLRSEGILAALASRVGGGVESLRFSLGRLEGSGEPRGANMAGAGPAGPGRTDR